MKLFSSLLLNSNPKVPAGRQVSDTRDDDGSITAKYKIILQSLQHVIHISYCIGAFIKACFFFIVQIKLYNFFPTVSSDHYRNTETDFFLSILTIQTHAAGK